MIKYCNVLYCTIRYSAVQFSNHRVEIVIRNWCKTFASKIWQKLLTRREEQRIFFFQSTFKQQRSTKLSVKLKSQDNACILYKKSGLFCCSHLVNKMLYSFVSIVCLLCQCRTKFFIAQYSIAQYSTLKYSKIQYQLVQHYSIVKYHSKVWYNAAQ